MTAFDIDQVIQDVKSGRDVRIDVLGRSTGLQREVVVYASRDTDTGDWSKKFTATPEEARRLIAAGARWIGYDELGELGELGAPQP